MSRISVQHLESYCKTVNETGPRTLDDIITSVTNLLSQWIPTETTRPLVAAWVNASISPAFIAAMYQLRYTGTQFSRLDNGLCVALNGLVEQTADGWTIHSSDPHHPEKLYHINGSNCDCPDSQSPVITGHKACKHQIAVWLSRKATASQVQ